MFTIPSSVFTQNCIHSKIQEKKKYGIKYLKFQNIYCNTNHGRCYSLIQGPVNRADIKTFQLSGSQYIAADKAHFSNKKYCFFFFFFFSFFLILPQKRCRYSIQAPHGGKWHNLTKHGTTYNDEQTVILCICQSEAQPLQSSLQTQLEVLSITFLSNNLGCNTILRI